MEEKTGTRPHRLMMINRSALVRPYSPLTKIR